MNYCLSRKAWLVTLLRDYDGMYEYTFHCSSRQTVGSTVFTVSKPFHRYSCCMVVSFIHNTNYQSSVLHSKKSERFNLNQYRLVLEGNWRTIWLELPKLINTRASEDHFFSVSKCRQNKLKSLKVAKLKDEGWFWLFEGFWWQTGRQTNERTFVNVESLLRLKNRF